YSVSQLLPPRSAPQLTAEPFARGSCEAAELLPRMKSHPSVYIRLLGKRLAVRRNASGIPPGWVRPNSSARVKARADLRVLKDRRARFVAQHPYIGVRGLSLCVGPSRMYPRR